MLLKEKEKPAQIPEKAWLPKPEATKTIAFTMEGGNKKIPPAASVRFLSFFLCQN
jgi:hypothetical protein